MSNFSEAELVEPTLELLAANPGGLSTTDLIEKLTELFDPDGPDAEILAKIDRTPTSARRSATSFRIAP